jgi:hypothetical protein
MGPVKWGLLFSDTDKEHVELVGEEQALRVVCQHLVKDGVECTLEKKGVDVKTTQGTQRFALCLRVLDNGARVIRAIENIV